MTKLIIVFITFIAKMESTTSLTHQISMTYPNTPIIQIKDQSTINQFLPTYLIQKIMFQKTEIVHILQKVKKFQENQREILELFNDSNNIINIDNNSICQRIDTEHICSFCDKSASFVNTNMKYYCWFHKCQID